MPAGKAMMAEVVQQEPIAARFNMAKTPWKTSSFTKTFQAACH